MVGIGGLLGVRVFGWKGVGNLGIGKVDLIWTPGRRLADFVIGITFFVMGIISCVMKTTYFVMSFETPAPI